jgi:YjbE family integral membrane protein
VNSSFLLKLATVLGINLVLSGDNAAVIALAVKAIPKSLRARATIAGTGLAIFVQVTITYFAAQLMNLKFLRLAGGGVILWIALKLLVVDKTGPLRNQVSSSRLLNAVGLLVVANLAMSTDNILAIAAIAQSDALLLVCGLGLSISSVVIAGTVLANLMEQYPVLAYLGAAVLGKVGAELLLTDPVVTRAFQPTALLTAFLEALAAVGVLTAGFLRRHREMPPPNRTPAPEGDDLYGPDIPQ